MLHLSLQNTDCYFAAEPAPPIPYLGPTLFNRITCNIVISVQVVFVDSSPFSCPVPTRDSAWACPKIVLVPPYYMYRLYTEVEVSMGFINRATQSRG